MAATLYLALGLLGVIRVQLCDLRHIMSANRSAYVSLPRISATTNLPISAANRIGSRGYRSEYLWLISIPRLSIATIIRQVHGRAWFGCCCSGFNGSSCCRQLINSFCNAAWLSSNPRKPSANALISSISPALNAVCLEFKPSNARTSCQGILLQ